MISVPQELSGGIVSVCIVCSRPVHPDDATAGSLYADGRQAFAHESHRSDRIIWLLSWLVFEEKQRLIQDDFGGVL